MKHLILILLLTIATLLPTSVPGALAQGVTTVASIATPSDNLLRDIQQIAAGSSHTCALTIAGGVKCWGDNSRGQLGDGNA